jgi:release factor glutamine methyltransferase
MNAVITIFDTVTSATRTLQSHSESPRLDAEVLLSQVLGVPRSALTAHPGDFVTPDHERHYAELITRRVQGEPVAYLTGRREFWSLPLTVSPAVLVPRPETETLVQHALQLHSGDEQCAVLDLGTGSGAIALALASERPAWRITGVDASPQALEVAAQNSRALQLSNIEWRLSHWFDALLGARFHLIVANPPYIANQDPALARLSAEPQMALTPGPIGLEALAAIISAAPAHLNSAGWLVLEHGASQGGDVAKLLRQFGFTSIRTFPDFAGKPRVTLATIHLNH